jgi:hypothetical protein
MITIIQIVLSAANIYLIFLCLGQLKTIASETNKKEDLTNAMDRFAEIYLKEKKKKIISFAAADKKDDD